MSYIAWTRTLAPDPGLVYHVSTNDQERAVNDGMTSGFRTRDIRSILNSDPA
jgi:hypothetical protein